MFRSQRSKLAAVAALMCLASAPSYGQSITFEQILSNPDDTALNLRFARQEIQSGRLQQAASALERILLTNPNWDSVRLLYGVVLYRLDDLEGARREFLKLEGRDLTPTQESDRLRYLGLVEHGTSPFRITGQISIGGRYDTNPGLVSDKIADATVGFSSGFPDLEFPISGMNDEEDVGLVAQGFIRIEGDIPELQSSTWFIEAEGDVIEFSDIDRASNAKGTVRVGLELNSENIEIIPYLKAGRVWVDQDEFSERWGGGVTAKISISPQFTFIANAEYLEEDYGSSSFSRGSSQHDGDLTTGYIGGIWRVTDSQTFTLIGFTGDKDARNDGFSYEKRGISLGSLTLLGRGAYLSLTGRYTETDYEQGNGIFNNPFVVEAREDEVYFARAAIGAPLKTIFEGNFTLPEFLQDVVMQVGVSWTSLSSNSSFVEYENISGDVMFTKRFTY